MSGKQNSKDPWTEVQTRNGFKADEVISALQKEIRRGQIENAAALAYEMMTSSSDLERVLWQRLQVISVEDIGFGDLHAPILVDTLRALSERYERGTGDRRLFAIHAVRYLAQSLKDRSSDELSQWLTREIESKSIRATIPDYAIDMHTERGLQLGRDREHFYSEAARISPELPGRELTYRKRLIQGLGDGGSEVEA